MYRGVGKVLFILKARIMLMEQGRKVGQNGNYGSIECDLYF